jgi:mono/diheme cytochrome c family protein
VTARDCSTSSEPVGNVPCQTRRGSRRRDLALTLVAWLASSALSIAGGQQAPPRTRTVLDGVYTQTQAERGLRSYTEHCSRCHRDNLRGNPEALGLTGTRFIEAWREDTLFSLFDHMATRMPREPRQTLPTPVYVDIVAFILQFNGYPAGERELSVEDLRQVYLVDKNGPQALPNLALIRTVGCLTPGPKGSWTLSKASEPVRERDGVTTTPEELRASADVPLGAALFELQNLDYLDAFSPESQSGHKVQVKGALVQRQAGQRISVTSVEPVAGSCL